MEPLTHKPTSDNPDWNESYYFVFYDKEHNLGAMSRVGFKPNRPEGMTFLFFYLPDGRAAAFHATDDGHEYPKALKVEGMTHECIEDGKWRYTFEGPLVVVKDPETLPDVRSNPALIDDLIDATVDLEFIAINETYEYSEHMTPEALELGKKTGDVHWEQIAIINGKIRLGDAEYEVKDAIGQRDHTHGIRDWTAIDNWFYFVIWFSKDLALNPAAVFDKEGNLGPGGFIFRDGRNIPIMEITLLSHELRKGSIFPSKTEVELIDSEGRKYHLRAQPGSIIPVPFTDANGKKSTLVQSFGSFELDGRKGGYGSYETLSKGSHD
jgi:hypothetical protein